MLGKSTHGQSGAAHRGKTGPQTPPPPKRFNETPKIAPIAGGPEHQANKML